MGTVRLGKRTETARRSSGLRAARRLDDIVFGGWDIFEDNCYEAAKTAGVLEPSLLDQVKDELAAITPMPAVFDRHYVKRLDGPNVKKGQEQEGPGRAADRRHPPVQGRSQARSARAHLVRQHRDLPHRVGRHQSIAAFEKGSRPTIRRSRRA
jgi:hypothetical protein